MIYFNNDYSEGCHESILRALARTNLTQTPGYGTDAYCRAAADRIRALCGQEDLAVHFLVGGTQTNLTAMRPNPMKMRTPPQSRKTKTLKPNQQK